MTEGCRFHQMVVQDSWFEYGHPIKKENEGDDHDHEKPCTSSTHTSSIGDDSSLDSMGSSDTTDDASSSSSLNSSYDLSDLMAQLPIKRGLSKFYQGKSESFTSLSKVTSIEDLAKKGVPYMRRNLKASKSCGKLNGTASYKAYTLPRAVISKKTATRASSFSSLPCKRGSFVMTSNNNSKPPMIPLHNNLE